MTKQWAGVLGLVLLASALVLGQDGGPQAPGAPGQAPPPGAPGGMPMQRRASGPAELHRREMGPDGMHGPGMHGPGMHGPGGKWWKSDIAQQIGLSEQQAQQMEKIYQDQRMQLIDLRANLEKQEAALEPLIEADQPNEQQVLGQIDKIAQARAALEKSNAQMHFSMRRVLTSDQWKKLQAEHMHPQPMPRRHMAPGTRARRRGVGVTMRDSPRASALGLLFVARYCTVEGRSVSKNRVTARRNAKKRSIGISLVRRGRFLVAVANAPVPTISAAVVERIREQLHEERFDEIVSLCHARPPR